MKYGEKIKQFEGYENATKEEQNFLDQYGEHVLKQEKLIADQKQLEDLEESLAEYLSKLTNQKDEYIVEGALLSCNNATMDPQILKYKTNGEEMEVESKPINIEDRSRLKLLENRPVKINGLIPANLYDCMAGLNDDEKKLEEVNIISFGNCRCIKNGTWLTIDQKNAVERGLGTCYCFAKTNREWENLPNLSHYAGGFPVNPLPTAGIASVLNQSDMATDYMRFNGKESINMMSMLFCNFGGGKITALESGQITDKMTVNEALRFLKIYMRGHMDEDMVNEIIDFIGENCSLEISDFKEGQYAGSKNQNKYDNKIKAWILYWERERGHEMPFKIRPDVIKAMIAKESSLGTDEGRNATRNVMQSLATGNPTLWIAAGINPYFKIKDRNTICYQSPEGDIKTDGALAEENLPNYTQEMIDGDRYNMHFTDFNILRNFIKPYDNDGKDEYLIELAGVTDNMSIAVGVGLLASKIIALGQKQRTEKQGVINYNSKPFYADPINRNLEDMGVEKLHE